MVVPPKASAHTLEQVRDLLDKVAKHPRLGKKNVVSILMNSGGVETVADETIASAAARMKPKKYGRVIRKCEEVLKDLPSEKDEELIGKINLAVTAEEKATSILTDRGVELGTLLLEAFHRYPTERPFRAFLKWTAFTTLKRAAELMFAAGGKKEGEELQRLLKRGADNTAKSRERTKPAITKPNVIADAPRIAGNGDDPAASAEARKAENTKLAGEEPVTSLETAAQDNSNKTGRDTMVVQDDGQTTMVHPEPVEKFEDKPLPVSVMLDNRLATIKGLTPWALWLECSEHLAALMNVPTREGMTKETASLVRRLTNNHHAKKAA